METNTFPLELLTNDNYVDWSVKMKNDLLAQGLWNIIKTRSKPPKPDDDVVEYEAWRKMNDAALHAILRSCGMDILSRINNCSSAKIAWEMLGDKVIQAEAVVDPIINEGNSSSSLKPGPEWEIVYTPLVEAVQRGDWKATREFLEFHPAVLTTIIPGEFMGRTVFHVAVDAEQEHIVEELVNMISEQHSQLLTVKDDIGFTALHLTTLIGNQRMAKCLITKNKSLLSIRDNRNELPIRWPMAYGYKELAFYLYSQTPFEDLVADQGHYATLLNNCISYRYLDMALELLERCPHSAFALAHRSNRSPLESLAIISADSFEGAKGMVFWKQWIYNYCVHISVADLALAADQFRLNIQNNGKEKTIGSVRADLWHQLVSSLLNLLGFKRLYEMKLERAQCQQLLSRMSQAIATLTTSQRQQFIGAIRSSIFSAIRRGNFEFLCQIVKANPGLLWIREVPEGRPIFHWAVQHRQHKIFSLIYNLKKKSAQIYHADSSRNNILHMAGMLTENTPINHIRGAALQMQREVQWFKEVERMLPLSYKDFSNKDGLTPRQLFTRDHQNLREKGEKWMKGTATSCTVVGALIITIMFAAAFTIPGGNNQDTGLPILVHDKLFILFIVTDSVSLFSSSTSVLIFLGILTSRYAEEDFHISLPRKMIIGLFALFFSITTMMIAFSTALLLMLHGKHWIVIPIIGLAGVPIILFVMMQFRLLIDMLVSTYGSSIFDRKMKTWL